MRHLMFRINHHRIRHIFIGRNRACDNPDKGRFTNTDFKRVTDRVWQTIQELAPHAPKFKRSGNRSLMRYGVYSLALYRVLSDIIEDENYIAELAGDIIWKFYGKSLQYVVFIGGLLHTDIHKRLIFAGNYLTRHVFSPPEYSVTFKPCPKGITADFYRCPIYDYFKKQGEKELAFFQKTWCTLDFAMPDVFPENTIRYTRNKTLSFGDDVCDMKLFVTPPENQSVATQI